MARRRVAAVVVALTLCLIARDVHARPAAIVIGDAISGPYKIAVLAAQQPFAIGQNEIRLQVLEALNARPIPEVQVTLTVAPIGRHGLARTFPAPRMADEDGGIYAGMVELPSRGEWQIIARVVGARGIGDVTLVARAGKMTPLLDALKVSIPPLTLTLLAAHFHRRGKPAGRRRLTRTNSRARRAHGGRPGVARGGDA